MVEGAAPTCPLCGGSGKRAIPREPRVYLRCQRCRSLWLEPRPGLEELQRYYDDGGFYQAAVDAAPRQLALAQERLGRLERLAGASRDLLDVGCADGLFLEEARARGWTVGGLEPSAALSTRALHKGLSVHRGTSPAAAGLGPCGTITAWEVLEHVTDPVAFVGELAGCLRPGGILALSTPDAASLASRTLGRRWPFASAPEHLVLFSRPALIRLMGAHRLRVVAQRGFSGLGPTEAASMLRRRAGAWAAGLAPAVSSAFGLLDWLGQGTEVEVYAVKDGAP